VATQEERQRACAVLALVVLLVLRTRRCSVKYEVRVYYVDADLDSSDPKSYRPISNLSVLSMLLEHLVSKQLVTYLLENDLFPGLHLAYRSNHSMETAVLKVLSDILLALDSGKQSTGCS